MKTHIATLTLALLALVTTGVTTGVASALESLRGDAELTAESAAPASYKLEVVQGGFERSFKEQPPMIPHSIEKYEISLRLNGCLKCHSEVTAPKENTKPTPLSHFLDRDGNRLEKLSGRRYFCTQCHTVQMSGQPLVENLFEGRQ